VTGAVLTCPSSGRAKAPGSEARSSKVGLFRVPWLPARRPWRHDAALHDNHLDSTKRLELEFSRRGAVRVGEEKMGTLFFVCPATGLDVSTGLVIDQATLRRLRLEKVNCPHCGAPHEMAEIRAWLSRDEAQWSRAFATTRLR
jgi:hypothetical protein